MLLRAFIPGLGIYDRGMKPTRDSRPGSTAPRATDARHGASPDRASLDVQDPASGDGSALGIQIHRDLMLILQDFATESARYADSFRRAHGLAHSDVQALAAVMAGDRTGIPLRAGDIARRLVISASAATAVIDRLVTRGHLTRRTDSRDRREVVLSATPSARATGKAMFAALERELSQEFATWPDHEVELFRRRLPELTEAVRRAQKSAPPPSKG